MLYFAAKAFHDVDVFRDVEGFNDENFLWRAW